MFLKRAIDVIASAAALLLLAPLMAAIALAIRLDSSGPAFYSQVRVGRGFRRFRIWKFRTMRQGRPGPAITAGADHRVTRAGRLLRRCKLDELPQFWNVLRGDMSLVGPRPEVPEYVELFRERYRLILTVRPGITDPASLRFRNEEAVLAPSADPLREYAERVLPAKLELAEDYLRRRSLGMDLKIVLQTVAAIVRH